MKKKIQKWEKLINEIVSGWIYKYFELSDDEKIEFDWMQIGEVFNFADYWFSFSTVLECYELGVSKEQLFLWYDTSLKQLTDLSLSDFILSPAKREEARVKYLRELAERVKAAKEELKQALDEHSQ